MNSKMLLFQTRTSRDFIAELESDKYDDLKDQENRYILYRQLFDVSYIGYDEEARLQ